MSTPLYNIKNIVLNAWVRDHHGRKLTTTKEQAEAYIKRWEQNAADFKIYLIGEV